MSKIPLTVFFPMFCALTLFFFSKSLSNWVNNKLTALTRHKNRPIQIQHLLNIYTDFKMQEFLCLFIYEFMNFACTETHLYIPDKRDRFTKMTFTVKKAGWVRVKGLRSFSPCCLSLTSPNRSRQLGSGLSTVSCCRDGSTS